MVTSADRRSSVVIRQETGEEFTIATVLGAIEPAQPGIYQLADKDAAVETRTSRRF
jgi:hypothetical protein